MKHLISKKKLLKSRLNEKQMQKVWSLKTRKEQIAQASRFEKSNKAIRKQKFLKTKLGLYTVKRQRNKIAELREDKEKWDKLTSKQKAYYEKEFVRLFKQEQRSRQHVAKDIQARIDMIHAIQDKQDKIKANLNAGMKAYFINRSTKTSYEVNNTANRTKEDFITSHYAEELQTMIDQGVSYQDAIEKLWDHGIASGEIKPLAQGSGYGYIDKDYKEVVSPV